ncbi:ydaY [Klebsiella pneumoniae]|uniref:YdaY n=1 Tax=Klebsiella pneumoniae TaxID=573 RepID=A0A377X9R4_KLEPN|nr:ydaY [Klebsiella pneumoniae]
MASSENPQYRSRNALVRRHIDKMDAGYKVGTKEFNLASVGDIDSVDDLLIDNVARFLLKGWEGVGQLVDGSEVALDYTPELGIAMLKQYPDLYWLILARPQALLRGKEQQTQETVKKP